VKPPEEKDDAAKLDEAEEVLGFLLPARCDAAPTLEPGEEALDLPASLVAPQHAAILMAPAVLPLRSDELDAALLPQAHLQGAPIPRLVGNQSGRKSLHESSVESSFGEHTVESVSACNMDSEWKTIAVCNRHEFRGVPRAAFADAGPPFFAGT
jgi:hypothetical protein